MSVQEQIQQVYGQESNFETIYQKRISELDQKVNKYCAQYDALMNLLPIGNNFTSVLNFQKDLIQINSKIDLFDSKVLNINKKEIEIDQTLWQKQYNQLEKILKNNQEQLDLVKKLQESEEYSDNSLAFEEQLNEKIKMHFEIIQSKLAHHKNNVEFKRHKQLSQAHDLVLRTLDQKIDSFFNPIYKEIDQIKEEIQIFRLRVPQRKIRSFHDFNYHRLLNQILQANQAIQHIFSLCNGQNVEQQLSNKVIEIERQIQQIHYQMSGSKKKCFGDLMTHRFLHHDFSSQGNFDLDKKIKTDFELLENNFIELNSKLSLLKKFVSNH